MDIFEGNLVDLHRREIYPAVVTVKDGMIAAIDPVKRHYGSYIIPGFVDAHIHIESSMLIPSQFARIATVHGTVAAVSDPHEIANVLGVPGVEFMIEDAKSVPFTFCFGASSCVPATPFETSGAKLDAGNVADLLGREEIGYLSEVMNFPAVIAGEKEIMAKIEAAKSAGKPVDGHAPGLRGEELQKYIDAGISTDHESFACDEAFVFFIGFFSKVIFVDIKFAGKCQGARA
jgi:adenine deaminase